MEVSSDASETLIDPKLRTDTACLNQPEGNSNECDKKCEEIEPTNEKQVVISGESCEALSENQSILVSSEDALQTEFLDFLARTDARFKSQQLGDPELTFAQKRSIASELLKKSPSQFLARFGTNIKLEHLQYFEPMRTDYEVDFYFRKLQRFHRKELNDVDIKNRRYEALRKLISEGSYFSEEEMKSRNPLLYEQLIGQHLTSAERTERAKDYSKMTYVGYLLDRMDRDSMNDLQQKQQDEEDGVIEEQDTDDESSVEEEEDMDRELNEKEKDVLRQEFISSMYSSFIEGKDKDFDYSSVDFNVEYDTHKDMEQDDEEKYFDSQTPESLKDEKESINDMEDDEEDELDAYMKELK